MFANFRLSMTWLHTWFGLVLGFVLMVVFFFGSLSVFDREIDRWAIPQTRFETQPMPSFEKVLLPAFHRLKPHPDDLAATAKRVIGPLPDPNTLPPASFYAYTTHRDPVVSIGGEFSIPNKPRDGSGERQHVHGWETIDPRDGRMLHAGQLAIGSQFFYPMHYGLHLEWKDLGYWIVGLAALTMLAALVSGVVMHRKLFRELFTFRPQKHPQRRLLDLHNLTGVVALPFHFFFALTGLIIFAGIYLPVSTTLLEPLDKAHEQLEATRTGLPLDPAGVPAPMASIDAMVAEAQRRWAARGMAGEVGYVIAEHLDDANGYVSVFRAGTDRVALLGEGIHFKASTGEVIREEPPDGAISGVNEYLSGLHLQQFRHWPLRALYFTGGLAGCICIATGFLFFVEKRKRQYAKQSLGGARWVDALAVTTVTGMLIATLSMLVASQVLPETLPARGDWEVRIFWLGWLLALLHAVWRSAPVAQARLAPAWVEQCVAVAALAFLAVLSNWIATGDHLLRTIGSGYWPVAGVDLVLLASGVIAALAARRLRRLGAVAAKAHDSNTGVALTGAGGIMGGSGA